METIRSRSSLPSTSYSSAFMSPGSDLFQTQTHHTISCTPFSIMATHRLEAIRTETLITSLAISTALGADAKLLTFIDVCRQNKNQVCNPFGIGTHKQSRLRRVHMKTSNETRIR